MIPSTRAFICIRLNGRQVTLITKLFYMKMVRGIFVLGGITETQLVLMFLLVCLNNYQGRNFGITVAGGELVLPDQKNFARPEKFIRKHPSPPSTTV